jgi:tetratricopeptide (TPR) repeat protein
LIHVELAITTIPLQIESYNILLSSLLFDKFYILKKLKKFDEALNALNNSLLPDVPIIYNLIKKAELLIDLNRHSEAKLVLSACINNIKPTGYEDYENLVDLYKLRKRINTVYENFEEMEKDDEKINEYLDKTLPF